MAQHLGIWKESDDMDTLEDIDEEFYNRGKPKEITKEKR